MRAEQARAGTGDPRLRPCALAALRAFWGGAVLRSSRFCVKFGGAPSPFSKFLCVCFLLLYSTRLDFLFAFVQNKNTTQGSARRSPETGTPCGAAPASTELGKPQTRQERLCAPRRAGKRSTAGKGAVWRRGVDRACGGEGKDLLEKVSFPLPRAPSPFPQNFLFRE